MPINVLKSNTNPHNLPNEYQEVEWIKSKDDAYINPNINITADIGFKVTANIPNDIHGALLGNYLPGNYFFFVYGYDDGRTTFFPSKGASTVSMTVPRNTKTTFSFINGVLDDGTTQTTVSTYATYEVGQPLYLFSGRPNNWFTSYTLYECEFYNGSNVISKLIPCYRKADSEIGVYDIITNNFYSNANSVGSFEKGNDVNIYTKQKMKLNLLSDNVRLPVEYEEIEYVQGSGTQYIDTGVKLSSADTVKCKFEITATPTDYSYREGIYGTMESIGGNNTFFVLLMRTPTLARVGTSSNQVTSTNVETNTLYDTTLSNGTYIENGITYNFTRNSGFTFTTNCYIFVRNQSQMLPTSAKVYSFEIVDKFKGVPCYRKSDNVAGFYDMISRTFFTNAGTGSFVAGPRVNLPDEYQEVEWIKGNIDTGEELEPKNVSETYEIVQYMEGYNNGYFFSNDKNSAYCRLGLRFLNNVYKMWFYFGSNNNTSANYAPLENKKIKIQLTKNAVDNNGRMAASCQYYDENGTLLGTNGTYAPKETVDNWNTTFADGLPKLIIGGGYKLYSFKKVNGKELVPCYRKSDSTVGMYDITNNEFIAATGTTDKGNDIPKYKIQPVKMNLLKETNNLLKLARTEWNSTSYQPTDLVTFDYNKIYYMAGSGYIRPDPGTLNETITRNYVTFTQTSSSWWGAGFPFEVKPNTKYTIGAKRLDGNKTKIIYTLYNADGSFDSYAQVTTNTSILDISLTITTGANVKTMIIVVAGISQGDTVYAYDLQVEEGQTITDFKPYGYEIIKI